MESVRPARLGAIGVFMDLSVSAPDGPPGRVLFVGQAYYNSWYLSRALRDLGWTADLLNWDDNPDSQMLYHGEDYRLQSRRGNFLRGVADLRAHKAFYKSALRDYDIFHFSNAHGMKFSERLAQHFVDRGDPGAEIRELKSQGKKIVYSNNGCLDGVSQTSFAKWGESPICNDCVWKNNPQVCSDERNLDWGAFRNEMADYQVLLGGNRADFNLDPSVHEVPEFYCLDPQFWSPELTIPDRLKIQIPASTVKIYHAVGNYDLRTDPSSKRNIKSTHIYAPLVDQLKREGRDVELIFCHDVPNRDVRFFQLQSDIVVDMLTYGFYGANVREAMMLGKPVVCYLRPEWLDQMRDEIPDYVDELPVVSATPETIREVLIALIDDPQRRQELGRLGRQFALKWHSAAAGAQRFDRIYRGLLAQ